MLTCMEPLHAAEYSAEQLTAIVWRQGVAEAGQMCIAHCATSRAVLLS